MTERGEGGWVAAAPQWTTLHGSDEDLARVAAQWPTTEATPGPVAEMLGTVRAMFTHTWFIYELGLPAITWSLVTVESALRHRLDRLAPTDLTPLHALVGEARRSDLIEDDWADRLDAARRLRNRLTHGKMHGVVTPGTLDSVLGAAHYVIAELFPDPPAPTPHAGT